MVIYSLSMFALVVGFLLAVVGSVLLLIKAIQTSIIWGLVTFFVPFGNLVFICVHWKEAKIGFLPMVVGVVMCVGGACGIPNLKAELVKRYPGPAAMAAKFPTQFPTLGAQTTPPAAATTAAKAPDLNTQIRDCRAQLEGLQGAFAQDGPDLAKQYQALQAQRKALKPADTAAITKFNEAAAAYQARNTARQQMQQQIVATQKQLDDLLDARARAGAPAAGQATNGKKVVMYTTSHCPACKAAKQYLAQKGVPYQEIDVETSSDGRAAFQKLGGHGVPLILVGDKRMEGFSPQALDAALL